MRTFFLVFFLISSGIYGQDYVDILRVGYGSTIHNGFKGSSGSTSIESLEVDFTFPIVLSESSAIISGLLYSRNRLSLYPEDKTRNLHSSTLKIGLASKINDSWSTTLLLLPKIASDYQHVKSKDIYLGGVALLKYKKKENLIYRFGLYSTMEAYGLYATPIIGWYYKSPNKLLEMDMSLPISAEINYKTGFGTVGFDYFGIGRSFRLYEDDDSTSYVDLSSLEFSSFFQLNTLKNSVLLRAKFGYSSNKYEVYENDDTIDLGLTAFTFGDNRTQLNPDLKGGLFVKLEAIYRFHIKKEKN